MIFSIFSSFNDCLKDTGWVDVLHRPFYKSRAHFARSQFACSKKMKDKALRNKQIIFRLTEDEHQQIKNAYAVLHMSQSDYIRKRLFIASQPSFLDQREIHNVRVIGIALTKILEKLNDTQMSDDEIKDILQLITEIKMIVRSLNDKLSKS